MTDSSPFNRGKVDWSGDNPGIYLKDSAEGPYVTLAVYFRIVVSPHGPGNVLLLLEDPNRSASLPEVHNLCISNNSALAHYLFDNFCRRFGAFRDVPAMDAVSFLPLDGVSEHGDGSPLSSYSVELRSGEHAFVLHWAELGEPFAADVLPPQSATGNHEMYSCFVEARDASIVVNGRRLSGRPYPRDFMGRPTSSAFLAFSETWVKKP